MNDMEQLSIKQQLRLELFKITMDVEKAKEDFDFVVGADKPEEGAVVCAMNESVQNKDLFGIGISDLGLSIRVYNFLRFHDIDTLGAICSFTMREISGFRGIGRKGIVELNDMLLRYGLSWGCTKGISK